MEFLNLSPLTTLFLLLSLFLAVLLQRRRFSVSPKLPPSPRKLPIIGHLHLLTDMPHHALLQLSRQLGPIVYLQLGRLPTVVVSSPQLAREIFKTHDHVFSSRPETIAAEYLSFGCSGLTFSPYGPFWRQARKICVTSLLSHKRVDSFQYIRDKEVNRLLSSLSTISGSETDVSEHLFSLSNDILCLVAFGRRFSEWRGKDQMQEMFTEAEALFAGFSIADFFPGLEWVNTLSGLKGRLKRNMDFLRAYCDEIIQEHVSGQREDSYSGREDFVDVMLRVQKGGDLDVPITDDNIKGVVLDMFVAGTDTTTATLEWTMTELARHPRVMKKAQDEVRRIFRNKGKVEEDDLVHLPYMKAVIKETFRLHPPVPLLVPRESMQTCILDTYEIPAKSRIMINTYAMGRDPQIWEKPLEYHPERFEGVDIDLKGQNFELLPFGGGRRSCPGYAFGLATIEITLARLLYHFDWKLPVGVEVDDVDLSEVFGLTTRKRAPLILVPKVNQDYEFKEAN